MHYLSPESFKSSAPRGNRGEAISPSKASSGGMDRDKDRRLIAVFGWLAAGMGNHSVQAKPGDFGSMDSWSEPRGNPSPNWERRCF